MQAALVQGRGAKFVSELMLSRNNCFPILPDPFWSAGFDLRGNWLSGRRWWGGTAEWFQRSQSTSIVTGYTQKQEGTFLRRCPLVPIHLGLLRHYKPLSMRLRSGGQLHEIDTRRPTFGAGQTYPDIAFFNRDPLRGYKLAVK